MKEQLLYQAVMDSFSGDQEEFVNSIREYRDQVDAHTLVSDGAKDVEQYIETVFIKPLEETR